MEQLKNMNLKKAFFLLSVCGLLISLCVVVLVWSTCRSLIKRYPSGGIAITSDGTITELEKPTAEQEKIKEILSVVPLFSGVLFPVIGLGAAGILFYRWKLKTPIALLLEGTERIRSHDLDFSFPAASEDELGQVCAAFEDMRAELQKTNQELWRQNEERKRLNAAFSHDLRNPVTVLKGTVRLLKENREDPLAIERLETYTVRIERYIEAMSSIQRLEQMPVKTEEISPDVLSAELEETARLLCPSLHKSVICSETGNVLLDNVPLDHGIFLTVAENLIGNAARFAKEEVRITLSLKKDMLFLRVEDDGPGFPDKLLKDGVKPFGKAERDEDHFGMGLYSSSLLCLKHGGVLCPENNSGHGAVVTASFQVGICVPTKIEYINIHL